MSEKRPERRINGKTYCPECGEQVYFLWAHKPRFCAMCGTDFNWNDARTAEERLRDAISIAEKHDSWTTRIETETAREILGKLEKDRGEAECGIS